MHFSREAADDEVLKTDLAYAYNRLASIQEEIDARARQNQLALANNVRAEELVHSLKNPNTELAQKVLAAVSLQRAGVLIESGKFAEARELLAQIEGQLGDNSPIKPIDKLNIRSGIEFERFQIFLAEGDNKSARASLQQIAKLRDEVLADGTRTDMSVISIVNYAGASELFLEPQQEFDELFYVLDTARMELTRIGNENPLIDMDLYLCTIDTKLGNTYFRTEDYAKALKRYQSAQERHLRIYQRDQKNLVAQYNLALAWQNIGDTHMAMANYDKANEAYDSAVPCFEKWNEQQGEA